MTRALITELDTGKTHRVEFTAADADALYGASRQGMEIAMGRPVYLGDTLHSADLLPFPHTDMVLGSVSQQLAEARRVAQWAGLGEHVSLASLCVTQDVLKTHGGPEDAALLLLVDAAILAARQTQRPDTSLWATLHRHGLLRLAVAAVAFTGFAWLGLTVLLA
jgi:hypothetical protein